MTKIENENQLRAEIRRLKEISLEQRDQLKKDLKTLREDLRPENILLNTFSPIVGFKVSKHDFFKDRIAYGISTLIQRFILKSEKKMEHSTYGFLDNLFDRVKHFINGFASQEAKRKEREEGNQS